MKIRSKRGFSLPEVLVAVAMVGVLAAVVLPSVVGQISKGEISRVVQDLQAVETGASLFRSDVGRWPRQLEDLVEVPNADDLSLSGTAYGTGNDPLTTWNGPYLSRGSAGIGLTTSLGGVFELDYPGTFRLGTWNGSEFVVIAIENITEAQAEEISLAIDGIDDVDNTNDAHGKVRHVSDGGVRLLYYASPRK